MRKNVSGDLGLLLLFGAVGGGILWAMRKKKPKPVAEEVLQEQAETAQMESVSEPAPEAAQNPEAASFVAWPGARRASEMFNAIVVEETRPSERAGRSGDPNNLGWLTTVAFWDTYPEALGFPEGKIPANFKEVPDWRKFADAWVRIYKGIRNIIASKGKKKKKKQWPTGPFADASCNELVGQDEMVEWITKVVKPWVTHAITLFPPPSLPVDYKAYRDGVAKYIRQLTEYTLSKTIGACEPESEAQMYGPEYSSVWKGVWCNVVYALIERHNDFVDAYGDFDPRDIRFVCSDPDFDPREWSALHD